MENKTYSSGIFTGITARTSFGAGTYLLFVVKYNYVRRVLLKISFALSCFVFVLSCPWTDLVSGVVRIVFIWPWVFQEQYKADVLICLRSQVLVMGQS